MAATTPAEAGPGLGAHGEHLSILIPTYDCAAYLAETLRSVQAQGSRVERAEIVVMDDHSTADDPEAVVRAVWGDRVAFHRHAENVGPTRNFNACLARATRPWIHVLHGDDVLLPDGYAALDSAIAAVPDALAVFGRTVYVDADGTWIGLTQRMGPGSHGRLAYEAAMWGVCPVQFASVLVSRRGLAAVGEFDEALSHVADYNLWWRLARHGPVAYSNSCTGAYRHFAGNHSATLRRTARNLIEHMEQVRRVEQSMRDDGVWSPAARRALYAPIMVRALRQTRAYLADPVAFAAHDRVLARLPLGPRSRGRRMELRLRSWALTMRASSGDDAERT